MITKHMASDFARWLTGDSRLWERRGLRSMATRREREGYCDLLLVGENVGLLMELWASVGFVTVSPSLPYLRELEEFSAKETLDMVRRIEEREKQQGEEIKLCQPNS